MNGGYYIIIYTINIIILYYPFIICVITITCDDNIVREMGEPKAININGFWLNAWKIIPVTVENKAGEKIPW